METVLEGLVRILSAKGIMQSKDAATLQREFENHAAQYVEDFLLEEGLVDKEQLLEALQEFYGVQAVDVLGAIFDHSLLKMFPKDVLLRTCCIPYYRDANILFVIATNPTNDELDAKLREFVSYDIEFFVGLPRHIDMMIKDFYQDSLYRIDYEENIDRAAEDEEEERMEDEHEREEREGLE
ncbi:MAG: hypothetical protein M1549_02290 [Candidatus Dependentiae bacterium]|nr:hypothetical protein [Candidatus Dependentiae bacterium]